jgi:DNA-binding NtrC family response regulator
LAEHDITILDESRSHFTIQGILVKVLEGPDKGMEIRLNKRLNTIGTGEASTIKLTDRSVSRNHLEIELGPQAAKVRDLDSKNGIYVGQVRIYEADINTSIHLQLGTTLIQLKPTEEKVSISLSKETSFGQAIGISEAMREIFAILSQVAKQPTSILLEGPTGTGKELLARAIHEKSARASKPFVILDCTALPPTLAERELFGHVRGAFTGANKAAPGLFEQANLGTLFIDELGELSLELQPKLLRALETGEYRALGSTRIQKTDVRVLSATNRDLLKQINHGIFRSDLFYRLSTIHLRIPPLCERTEDIPLLMKHFLTEFSQTLPNPLSDIEMNYFMEQNQEAFTKHPWPGNARQLRNKLEASLASSKEDGLDHPISLSIDLSEAKQLKKMVKRTLPSDLPFAEAKSLMIDQFEKAYLEELLKKTDKNISEAARQCKMDRRNLQKLLRKHGL